MILPLKSNPLSESFIKKMPISMGVAYIWIRIELKNSNKGVQVMTAHPIIVR